MMIALCFLINRGSKAYLSKAMVSEYLNSLPFEVSDAPLIHKHAYI
jgi:hypothetical protein